MTLAEVLARFRLPAASVLDRRVAKSDFADQLATPADRRLANERIETLHWHAALNSANTTLPAEGMPGLAVVTLTTRGTKALPPPRLVAMVHRAVPDPLVLVTAHDGPNGPLATTLSVKPALGDVLIAELPVTGSPPAELPPELGPLLAVDRAASLSDLHRRWTDACLGLAAFRALQRFPRAGGDPQRRRAALDRVATLDAEIRKLTAAARREKQAGRRAELNQRLQHARRQRNQAAEVL